MAATEVPLCTLFSNAFKRVLSAFPTAKLAKCEESNVSNTSHSSYSDLDRLKKDQYLLTHSLMFDEVASSPTPYFRIRDNDAIRDILRGSTTSRFRSIVDEISKYSSTFQSGGSSSSTSSALDTNIPVRVNANSTTVHKTNDKKKEKKKGANKNRRVIFLGARSQIPVKRTGQVIEYKVLSETLNPSGIQKKRNTETVPFFELFEDIVDMAFSDNFGAAIADGDVYFWGVTGEVEKREKNGSGGNSDSTSSVGEVGYGRKKTLFLKGIAPTKLRFYNRQPDEQLTKVFCSESSVWALSSSGRVVVWEEVAQKAEELKGQLFDLPPKILNSVEVDAKQNDNSNTAKKLKKPTEVCDLAVGKSHCGCVMVDQIKDHSELSMNLVEFENVETGNRKPSAFFLGLNDRGQCGIPDTHFVQKFSKVNTLEDFDMETPAWKSVAVGGKHSFLLSKSGAVYSFGCDCRCQLGVGDSRSVFRGSRAEHDAYTFQKFQQSQAVNSFKTVQNYQLYPFGPDNQNFQSVTSNFNPNYFGHSSGGNMIGRDSVTNGNSHNSGNSTGSHQLAHISENFIHNHGALDNYSDTVLNSTAENTDTSSSISDAHCTPNLQKLAPPPQFSKFPPATAIACGTDFTVVQVKAVDARKCQDFSELRMYSAPTNTTGVRNGFHYSVANVNELDVINNASSRYNGNGNNGQSEIGTGAESHNFDILFAFGNNMTGQCGRSTQQSEQPTAGVVRLPQRRIKKVVCGDRHAACLIERKRNGNGNVTNSNGNSSSFYDQASSTSQENSASEPQYDLFVWGSNAQGQIMPRNSLHTVCPPKNITRKLLKETGFVRSKSGRIIQDDDSIDSRVERSNDSSNFEGRTSSGEKVELKRSGSGTHKLRILDVWAGPECLAVYVEEDV